MDLLVHVLYAVLLTALAAATIIGVVVTVGVGAVVVGVGFHRRWRARWDKKKQ